LRIRRSQPTESREREMGDHWAAEQRESKRHAAGIAKSGKTGEERWKLEQKKRQEEDLRKEAERARWKKALPAILSAIAAAVKKAPARVAGLLGEILLVEISRPHVFKTANAEAYVPRGRTAEDLVRHAVFIILAVEASSLWAAPFDFPKRAKTFGVDVRKILEEADPPETVQTSAKAPSCRKCGCTEDKACNVGGAACSWVQKPNPKTGKGLCSACAGKKPKP